MKTKETRYLLIIAAAFGLMMTACNKEKSPQLPLPAAEVNKVQNSDAQDAIADKNESEIDNTLDQLQIGNYSTSALKDAFVSGSRTITVDHPDSTTFPKVITIVYDNFQDSTANESFVKNGEIDITVSLTGNNKLLVTWEQVFKNFSITTDSTTVTVSGTRTVTRNSITAKFNGFISLRVTASDHITGDLSYAITRTGVSDSLKFTRIVDKLRNVYLHFNNVGGMNWQTIRFRNIPSEDTIKWTGSVTGMNEDDEAYSKTVETSDPITVIFYKGTPVIASGIMHYTNEGTGAASYTISFREDPEHPHFTEVTVTNDLTNKTRTFDRKLARRFVRWW